MVPFYVGVYASATTRFRNRRVESIADFPDSEPAAVFRATKSGLRLETGATTQVMFDRHNIALAQDMVGEALRVQIVGHDGPDSDLRVHFTPQDAWHIISHAPTPNNETNVYLARITLEHIEKMNG